MGFRLRKSLKIAPGVRLNISKSGIGASAGVPGFRHAVHSSGRRTTMVGNPIFGSGYVHQSGGTRRSTSARSASQTPAPRTPTKPGFFAPKGEKHLWKALTAQDPAAARQVGVQFADYRTAAYSIAGFLLAKTDGEAAERLLAEVLTGGQDPAQDAFIRKYVTSLIRLAIAPGVEAELPICRDAIGLLVAEIRQEEGDLEGAIDAVEQLEPTTFAAVSLAELYSQLGRYEEVIELTDGVENEDDATALLLTYRGIALREAGYPDASIEAFKAVIRTRSRDAAIRNLAFSERAKTYAAQGKKAMARKDLERVLAADSTYAGVRERLRELGT